MGNKLSDIKGQEDEYSALMSTFKVLKQERDPLYGEGVLLQSKESNELFFLKEHSSTDNNIFQKTIENHNTRLKLNHPFIVKLIRVAQKTDSEMCGKFYKIYSLYEYFEDTILHRVKRHLEQGTSFSETDLARILYHSADAIKSYFQNGFPHQNITPSGIFLNESNYPKVADWFILEQTSLFSQVCSNSRQPPKHSYLSPLLLEELKAEQWQPLHDAEKSDIFSLGMVIIHAGLLEELDECYQYDGDVCFFQDVFEERLGRFKQKYYNLGNIIDYMTQINEADRINLDQLLLVIKQSFPNIDFLDSQYKGEAQQTQILLLNNNRQKDLKQYEQYEESENIAEDDQQQAQVNIANTYQYNRIQQQKLQIVPSAEPISHNSVATLLQKEDVSLKYLQKRPELIYDGKYSQQMRSEQIKVENQKTDDMMIIKLREEQEIQRLREEQNKIKLLEEQENSKIRQQQISKNESFKQSQREQFKQIQDFEMQKVSSRNEVQEKLESQQRLEKYTTVQHKYFEGGNISHQQHPQGIQHKEIISKYNIQDYKIQQFPQKQLSPQQRQLSPQKQVSPTQDYSRYNRKQQLEITNKPTGIAIKSATSTIVPTTSIYENISNKNTNNLTNIYDINEKSTSKISYPYNYQGSAINTQNNSNIESMTVFQTSQNQYNIYKSLSSSIPQQAQGQVQQQSENNSSQFKLAHIIQQPLLYLKESQFHGASDTSKDITISVIEPTNRELPPEQQKVEYLGKDNQQQLFQQKATISPMQHDHQVVQSELHYIPQTHYNCKTIPDDNQHESEASQRQQMNFENQQVNTDYHKSENATEQNDNHNISNQIEKTTNDYNSHEQIHKIEDFQIQQNHDSNQFKQQEESANTSTNQIQFQQYQSEIINNTNQEYSQYPNTETNNNILMENQELQIDNQQDSSNQQQYNSQQDKISDRVDTEGNYREQYQSNYQETESKLQSDSANGEKETLPQVHQFSHPTHNHSNQSYENNKQISYSIANPDQRSSDANQKKTQQYSSDNNNLLTNFDELKLQLHEAELKAQRDYNLKLSVVKQSPPLDTLSLTTEQQPHRNADAYEVMKKYSELPSDQFESNYQKQQHNLANNFPSSTSSSSSKIIKQTQHSLGHPTPPIHPLSTYTSSQYIATGNKKYSQISNPVELSKSNTYIENPIRDSPNQKIPLLITNLKIEMPEPTSSKINATLLCAPNKIYTSNNSNQISNGSLTNIDSVDSRLQKFYRDELELLKSKQQQHQLSKLTTTSTTAGVASTMNDNYGIRKQYDEEYPIKQFDTLQQQQQSLPSQQDRFQSYSKQQQQYKQQQNSSQKQESRYSNYHEDIQDIPSFGKSTLNQREQYEDENIDIEYGDNNNYPHFSNQHNNNIISQQPNNYSNFDPYMKQVGDLSNPGLNSQRQPQLGGTYENDIDMVIENYSNGSRYEGEKFNGMRHGQGRFFYQDGGLYDGEWFQNKMSGRGVLRYGSGKVAYEGQWKNDKFHGFGVLFNDNPVLLFDSFDYRDFDLVDEYWAVYDGEFKEDNKEGFGTLYLSNGERFEGSFKGDCVCGPGSYFKQNGTKVEGIWKNNKLTLF